LRCPKKSLLRDGSECVNGRGMRCFTCVGDQSVVKRVSLAAVLGQSISGLTAHTSKFIAVSRSVARGVAELGTATHTVEIVPNFLDVGPETVADPERPPTVLYIGPNSPHKGRSVAIEAFRRMSINNAQLCLVGDATPTNMPGVTAIGYLPNNAVHERYRAASVLAVPSVWPEPCPTVILEAMAHSLPVVGSRIGGIPELVEDGCSGLLVPPNDPAALAKALAAVITDPDLRRRLGEGARARAVRFDASVILPQIERIYKTAVQTGSAI
jgi:glycosyltransferase involved in cell wall biosynthesis